MVKKGPNAHWSLHDETTLLDYLWDHRSEAGEGMSFKAPTLAGAAVKLQGATAKGGPKTAGSCKNKWGKVRDLIILDIFHSDQTVCSSRSYISSFVTSKANRDLHGVTKKVPILAQSLP